MKFGGTYLHIQRRIYKGCQNIWVLLEIFLKVVVTSALCCIKVYWFFGKQFAGISRFFKNAETTIVAYHANTWTHSKVNAFVIIIKILERFLLLCVCRRQCPYTYIWKTFRKSPAGTFENVTVVFILYMYTCELFSTLCILSAARDARRNVCTGFLSKTRCCVLTQIVDRSRFFM